MAMAKAERKTESFPPSTESRRLVRVGEGAGCSTFRAADESRKGKPFIAVQSGSDMPVFGQTGWQRGKYALVPVYQRTRAFLFIMKALSILQKAGLLAEIPFAV